MAEDDFQFQPVTLVSPDGERRETVDSGARDAKLRFDGWLPAADDEQPAKPKAASKRAPSRSGVKTRRSSVASEGARASKRQAAAEKANDSESGVASVNEQGA